MFKELSFSHLRLSTIWPSYCLWILVKQIARLLNKHLSVQSFFAVLNLTVLKSYLKCWNANSDKTEFRCKDNIEISAVTGKIDQFTSGADLGGGCRGCAPPPSWDDLRLSNTTGILPKKKTMWFIGVEVEPEMSAPPPKQNPGSAPERDSGFLELYFRFQSPVFHIPQTKLSRNDRVICQVHFQFFSKQRRTLGARGFFLAAECFGSSANERANWLGRNRKLRMKSLWQRRFALSTVKSNYYHAHILCANVVATGCYHIFPRLGTSVTHYRVTSLCNCTQ